MVKVSVVVPVYNPGPFIEPGIESMVRQTLPADEFEVIYVDDGSTDDTPARLDALAAAHANVRVIHTPNSGWAGRPRNIGIREANGEYIQFLDQDDAMPPDALRMLYEMGVRNRSDIVIGKVASNFRPVPQHLFRHNIDACTIRDAPLISSLTPHKMFRTAFLRDNGIEFPEGRRRLEDQLFMVRAYLVARVVSVLADAVCYIYARRADGGNAGHGMAAPALYFGNLREVLDVIVGNTEPGEFRTGLLSRFYRTGMIDRLSEPYFLARSEAMREATFDEIHRLAVDFIDDDVHATMGTMRRLRSTLLRTDRRAELVALATRLQELRAQATLDELQWVGGRLLIRFHASLVLGPDGRPFETVRREGRAIIDPRLLEGIHDDPFPLDEPSPWGHVECFLRERTSGAEWRVPAPTRVEMARSVGSDGEERLHPVYHSKILLQLDRAGGGHPIEAGEWELRVRVFGPGIDRRSSIVPIAGALPAPAAMVTPDGATAVVARVEADGVVLTVQPPRADGQRSLDLPVSAAPLEVGLPLVSATGTAPRNLEVVARRRGSTVRLAGRIVAGSGTASLVVLLDRALAAGSWRLTARVNESDQREGAVGTIEVSDPDQDGQAQPAGRGSRLRRVARRLARFIGHGRTLRMRRALPGFVRRRL